MNSVERVKDICKERKIPISKLEKDCGFSNGYIGQLRKGVFPADRLDAIATYLGVSVDYLLGKEKTPTVSGERDILDEVDIGFYGEYKELSEDDKETVRDMVRLMRQRRASKEEK